MAETTKTGNDPKTVKPKPVMRSRVSLWFLLVVGILALVGGGAVLAVTGRSVPVPDWIVARAEARLTSALAGQGSVGIGGADLLVDEGWVLRLRLRDVVLASAAGTQMLSLPDIRVTLSRDDLLAGRFQPVQLRVLGANLTLRRTKAGAVTFDLTANEVAVPQATGLPGSVPAVLELIDRAFAVPELAKIEGIKAEGLMVTLDDARAGRVWRIENGRVDLTQTLQNMAVAIDLSWTHDVAKSSRAEMSFAAAKGSGTAQLSVRLSDVPAADVATQAPALAWLAPLEAPISGSLEAELGGSGLIGPMKGRLQIGAGVLRPAGVAQPIQIKQGSVDFVYDPETARVDFTRISVDSRVLRMTADGHVDLADPVAGLPQTLIGQMRFSDMAVDPAGLFEEPVRFSQGAVDLRLRLDPFKLDIGQMVVVEDGRRIEGRGQIGAQPTGWDVSLDIALDRISHDRLLALWPVGVVPKTRLWLAQNVQTGQLFDVKAALRLAPGMEPRLSLGYEFSDTDVRFIKTLPPITAATGYAEVQDSSFVLVVDKGTVTSPKGGAINMAGTVFRVPDIRIKPALSQIDLVTDSSITAAMSLLDEPPFGFLTKAGQPIDAAEGRAQLKGRISFPLAAKVTGADVQFDVTGQLTDLRSTRLVPGRQLVGPTMMLTANAAGMSISGKGLLDGVPFDAEWSQIFGPKGAGKSHIKGAVELSPLFLKAFRVGLPDGALTGKGLGQFEIDLAKGNSQFRLMSDLRGLKLRIPEIGWSKAAAGEGLLDVAGNLGAPPKIKTLTLRATGLTAEGGITLNGDGTLNAATFSRVQVGDWLDGPVVLTGRGLGRPVDVTVKRGQIDLRRAAFGGGGKTGGALSVALDRLVISKGIELTDFKGKFNGNGGFNGSFAGLVNGTAPVIGTVAPAGARSAIRLQSQDAGAVFRAAGVFDRAADGVMDLTLTPSGQVGNYDGTLEVSDTRIKDAPALAALLGAISVIGLLEQLNGSGIVFNTVQAEFRLTPTAVEIRRGSAIGSSLGVTMAGLYALGTEQMDLQGLISPIYLLNGIGSIFTRRGEGLFGFDYTLRGTPGAPRVSVNPLSLFTPGMFRELFRREPPTLPQAGN